MVLGLILAGCTSQTAEPAKQAPGESINGTKNNSGTDSAMEVSEDGKSVTFGNGSGGSADDSDEDDVVSGGTMGMKKENETKPPTSSSGGQIVDVGGSIPVR